MEIKINKWLYNIIYIIIYCFISFTLIALLFNINDLYYIHSIFHWFFARIIMYILITLLLITIILFCSCDLESNYSFKKLCKFLVKKYDCEISNNYFILKIEKMKTKKIIYCIISVILLMFLVGRCSSIYNGCVNVYNKSAIYQNQYKQKEFERKSFYDKLWKVYSQKMDLTIKNKETFIEVTKIIMENRADGKNVAWKWLQENQNIPYEEFTKFYSDLSIYIEEQREEYFKLEKDIQNIANSNNVLLDTFPNVLYNKMLKCQKINYECGFTSDKTDNVFKSKKENINENN